MMPFNDHHIFTIDDWRDIVKRFNSIDSPRKIILTTEKDAMRFMKFRQELSGMPFFVIPIENQFLFNQENEFTNAVISFLENFKQPS
jgi:tetraacyldisaccharide 4'-kinase